MEKKNATVNPGYNNSGVTQGAYCYVEIIVTTRFLGIL